MVFQRRSGTFLMGTAVIHMLLGVAMFWQPLQAIARAGVINAITPHYDRATIFWFLLFGALLWILGQMTQWLETKYGDVPRSLGWGLLVIALIGVLLIPVSGFWLVIPQAYLLLKAADGKLSQRVDRSTQQADHVLSR